MKKTLSIILLISLTSLGWCQGKGKAPEISRKDAQARRTETRQGNHAYNGKHYDEAVKHYSMALKKDSNYYKAQYNLGNAMYRQGNYSGAGECYTHALQDPSLKPAERSKIHYNLGNSNLQSGLAKRKSMDPANPQQDNGMQDFQQAVNNYKESLKLDPKSQDAKYNLSYAMKMLRQAQQEKQQNGSGGGQNDQQKQQQQQQQQGQGQQNQDKNKGKGDQQSNQQPQNSNDGQGKDDQQKQKQQQQQQQQKDQKKKEAEQLLNAVRNNEKQTMKDQMKAKEAKVDGKIEKDW